MAKLKSSPSFQNKQAKTMKANPVIFLKGLTEENEEEGFSGEWCFSELKPWNT